MCPKAFLFQDNLESHLKNKVECQWDGQWTRTVLMDCKSEGLSSLNDLLIKLNLCMQDMGAMMDLSLRPATG